MGDVPPPSSSSNDYPTQEGYYGNIPSDSQTGYSQGSNTSGTSFQPQYQQQQQQFDLSHNAFSTLFDMTQPQLQGPGRPSPYNMGAMANALPQTGYRPGYITSGQHRFNPGVQSAGMVQQMPPMAQYPAQSGMNPLGGQQYYMPQHPHMQSYYNAQLSPSQQQASMSPRHNMSYYPNQVMMNHAQQAIQGGYYYPQPNQFTGQSTGIPGQTQIMQNQYMPPNPGDSSPADMSRQGGASSTGYGATEESSENRSNIVRGPPRKPRQSGHAIWVGNLPPQTDLMSLVHHVCKEAPGLESLFLISKSNCAFANFKDEQSCVKAQQKLHDSKFQSVRLVSRLRKNTVEGASGQTAPTGPAATSPSAQATPIEAAASPPITSSQQATAPSESDTESKMIPAGDPPTQKDRFFILKSLTLEDLELSVRNGVWATQSHNEETLNNAFKAVDNVYLIFSANKSGEYFGYARMMSPINDDPLAAIEFAPKAQTTNDVDLPKAIPTEPTDFCPRGNIIDDSARGTIFWEIEHEDGDGAESDTEGSVSAHSGQDGDSGSKAWGKPFKLEWLSTTRLPFYRTRGLRNPWNSNREVKIARDGTEMEPSVGRRLIGLFNNNNNNNNRVQSPAPVGIRQGMTMVPGYPPPRRPYPQ